MRLAAGREGQRQLKRLHRAQIDLAMSATRAASPDDADLIRRRAAIHGKRQQLWAAPGVTEALGISAVGVER
ncbi:MAG: hypothetical protein M3452_06440, partial [Chloroflexota bacterium]|nr:hypothetical protein [Chloroflexota bacterium]